MATKSIQCICPVCAETIQVSGNNCPKCRGAVILNKRYLLVGALGQNKGMTWLAWDLQNKQNVVIKELSVHKLASWKEQELFQREMQILQQLDHPGIPKFIDDFFIGESRRQIFYFVQEHLEGNNLKEEMKGTRFTEKQVLNILLSLLEILLYLQNLRPPVVHRDIKPSNIIRKQDGTLALIDFGAVVDIFRTGDQGSTVAGTFGFMAPEQLFGRAGLESDLYGLGMTAIVLLCRLQPEEMIDASFKINWDRQKSLSEPVKSLLKKMISQTASERPSPEDAIALVKQTLKMLDNPQLALQSAKPESIQVNAEYDKDFKARLGVGVAISLATILVFVLVVVFSFFLS
ncbi:MAG: protein kinase [Spirochaetales bacterium]|nr:protein kinase [Spirochaetales bacterium]